MNTSINQLHSFSIFFLVGMIIAILFDIFRILRKSFKTSDFVTYIEDIIFWILTGGILLYSIFTFNHGELRSYLFIAMAFGIVFYILLISKFFIKINVKIVNTIKNVILSFLHLILKPILGIFKLIRKLLSPITFLFINFKNKLSKRKMKTVKNRN